MLVKLIGGIMQDLNMNYHELISKKNDLIKQYNNKNKLTIINKKIAILTGSTSNFFKELLDLFLISKGIKPNFYISEFNKYYEDSIFGNKKLDAFMPDIVILYTTNLNISQFPEINNSKEYVLELIEKEVKKIIDCWSKLTEKFNCQIIQNNFEMSIVRNFGNKDTCDYRGNNFYINNINIRIAEESIKFNNVFIHDLSYQSMIFGLDNWYDKKLWYAYKIAFSLDALPMVVKNISNQICAIYGKSKKCIILDLDNTLWGGVIGDDGVNNINLNPENPEGAAYIDFQRYILKIHKKGILLAICSKNYEKNVELGLSHPNSILKLENFQCIIANWKSKDENIIEISQILNIGLDSIVFIDDNPAERHLIINSLPDVSVPDIGSEIDLYSNIIEKEGYFETINILSEDLNKSKMYSDNKQRIESVKKFESYEDYLKSLKMIAEVYTFESIYLDRIHQLINKTNQFNLTNYRITKQELLNLNEKSQNINISIKLFDLFGDNGLISALSAEKIDDCAFIRIWVMSCRVFSRGVEFLIFDVLINKLNKLNVKIIKVKYIKSNKNSIVIDLLNTLKFKMVMEYSNGDSDWRFDIMDDSLKNEYFIEVQK